MGQLLEKSRLGATRRDSARPARDFRIFPRGDWTRPVLRPPTLRRLELPLVHTWHHTARNMDEIPLSLLFHRALLTASKALSLPTIEDETQV